MRAETRLIWTRGLAVCLAAAAAIALAARDVPAGLVFLALPALQLPRWLAPILRARRALRAPPEAYSDRVVALSYPAGWTARESAEGRVHVVSLVHGPSSVRVFVHPKGTKPAALIDAFVSQLLGALTVQEVTRLERPLAGAPATGARAVVTRWNDAAVAQVLAAALPDGRAVAVQAVLPLGVPEAVLDTCLRELRVG